MKSLLEHLPNELFLHIFQHVDAGDLYRAFWGLNHRLNTILQSLKDLSLYVEKNDVLLMKIFASRVRRLEVNTWHEIDLSQFDHLKSLKLSRTTRNQVTKIRPDILPYLVRLSVSIAFDFWSSTQLAQDVFSNGFPLLRYADLGRVDLPFTSSWSLSPHLRTVCVCSRDPIIVPLILSACPRLVSLQVEIFGDNHRIDLPSFRRNHLLRRLTFSDSYGVLSLDDIKLLLTYTPNVGYIHLTLFEMSFTALAHVLVHQLHRLKILECYINEPSEINENMDDLRTLHPCFHRIQCLEKKYGIRYFTNK